MRLGTRFLAIRFCSLVLPLVLLWHARAQQLPENYQNLSMYELDRVTDALAADGFTAAEKAEAFTGWMAVNDWRSLEIHNLYNLYTWISADAVDPRRFSARWSGSLTAPTTGVYTFRQMRIYSGNDSRLKVVIGGQAILDTTGDASDESDFTSAAVQLTAGQPVLIQVELIHDVRRAPPIYDFSENAPMVVLLWSTGQGDEKLIPSTAFAPPAGFAEGGAQGLKGEYFGNAQFGDLRLTRLDPGLDLVWTWPPIAPTYQQQADEVFGHCKDKILDGTYLEQCAAAGRGKTFSYTMWRIAYQMTVSERRQLVETLQGEPDILQSLSPATMGRLMQAIHVLPGDEHLDLLGEWALARPQPRCEAGVFPGYGEGYYQALNTDFWWLIGRFMQGPYANDLETLCDEYLERPDGECNLAVAYVAAYASRLNGKGDEFLNRISEYVNDPTVTGDALMTWLVARAFAQGALPGSPQPMAGFSDLESAYMVAESSDHKFWALQEMVARLSSVKKGDQAQSLIEQHRSEFTSPAQQQAMATWSSKADSLAATYAQQQIAQEQAAGAAYRNELERRRQAALERGDNSAAGRYAELISAAEASEE